MHRLAMSFLKDNWLFLKDRKPLIVRGARQVGKTWLARALAEQTGRTLIEINFEKNPELSSLFDNNDPKKICFNIETYFGRKINPIASLLFLDEIQDAPDILSKLRWFYEDLPELPVVATGSLLEFLLQEKVHSMPVGRVSYLYLEPFSFEEFLLGNGKEAWLSYIHAIEPPFSVPQALHQNLMDMFKIYLRIGGMPAVIKNWIEEGSVEQAQRIQGDILSSYRDDFFKYRTRMDIESIDNVCLSIPRQLGKKFVFSKVDSTISAVNVKKILALFNKAGLCHVVKHTAGNGVPLGAETKDKGFKEIFLDVGLVNRMLGNAWWQSASLNEGGLSEQVVGQILRTTFPFYMNPSLYYWCREEKNASAELDYLFEHDGGVFPIEVKSGSTGSLKSLHLFMDAKQYRTAVRINSDLPSLVSVNMKSTNSKEVSYNLISIPFYLIGQIHRILSCVMQK